MALNQRLDLKQSQSLVMTPQLQQAIKLLQMSNLEAAAFIEAEIEQNPLLEKADNEFRGDESGDDGAPPADGPDGDGLGDPAGDLDSPAIADSLDLANADMLPATSEQPLDTGYEDRWEARDSGLAESDSHAFDTRGGNAGGRSDFSQLDGGLEETLSEEETLREKLLRQLAIDVADSGDRLIGLHLIEMLDESGWLAGDIGDVAELLSCPEEKVAEVLDRLQRFEPAGLFARSLRECLALQLRDRDRLDPAMEALLDNLDLVAKGNRSALLKACGVDGEDLADMMVEIRALDPKPALAYNHEVTQPVTPDILMRPHPDGGWQVELNSDNLPRVLVDQTYYSRVSGEVKDRESRDYLNERLNTANWLVKALHQRATTILKVSTEIVRQQDAFFIHGVAHMRPLILRDVAEVIGMHESTVSRVTSNKYMTTPRGIYELKYFFTTALSSADGGATHSAESVRHRIKELCDAEPPKAILSDDDIAGTLQQEGIDIARRTVAKYREAMGVPSSVQRRRNKTTRI